MLERFAHFLVRRRRAVLIGTVVTVLVSGAVGSNVTDRLFAGGFDDATSESSRATEVLRQTFGQAPPNLVLLVTAEEGTVNDEPIASAGRALAAELAAEEGVGQVLSHWALGPDSPLRSSDATKAIVAAEIAGNDDERAVISEDLIPAYTRDAEGYTVRVGGFEAVFREVSERIESDLARSEFTAVPITLVLLIVVFGSLVAAVLPVGIGIIAILGTFLILLIVTGFTDVSVFALPMVTALGLGLSIDYSLFIVSRFREELRAGADTESAVVRTVMTAGRTIIVSGITVGVSLAALLVFPMVFFRSFGFAGIGVVAMALLGAVVFLPAMLATLGHRIDRWAIRTPQPKDVGEGFWHRLAMFVMRRPVPITIGVVALLLLLGVPFLHARVGLPDERVLPPGAETREVHDVLRSEFPTEEVQSVRVVAQGVGDPSQRMDDIASYATVVSGIDGVERVDSMAGLYADGAQVQPPNLLAARYASPDATWFQVVPSVDPGSAEAEDVVHEIRGLDTAFGDVLVGGPSAQLVDAKDSMFSALPWAIAIIAIVTFVLLFMAFGSILVPVKALVLNLLSLTATFGAMVWIFQDGHLSGFLDFTATGQLDISSPILMFCIAFGLSMDYEVFLLSRIKEEYDRTGDNEHSVAVGLERTGRLVTAAAVLISVVFLAIGTSSVRFIKLFGIGMALAILMDAFIIRGTLVPAFMRLAGRANWWLPSWLRGVHTRVAIREAGALPPTSPTPTRPPRKPAAKRKPAKRTPAKRTPAKATRKQTTTRTRATARRSAKKQPARKQPTSKKTAARKR